ncbi:inosine/xanthosine triphosphatase [Candidatus Peregrinibacteria bacterium]|nr:inosine/xanthosine triphosphatase [Candidatus Peregrinibacteria bacterium]
MKKLVIASKNPVKLSAVKNGFQKIFPNDSFDLIGISVESGVPDQPMGDEETYQGALNRVNAATKLHPEADYCIGLEGGLEEHQGQMMASAWICIKSKTGKLGRGRTGSFILPEKITELVKAGKELGHAADSLFKTTNIKQSSGTIGLLTNDIIDRSIYYTEAVVLALIPFINPELYE